MIVGFIKKIEIESLLAEIESLKGTIYTDIKVPVIYTELQVNDLVLFDPDNKVIVTLIDSQSKRTDFRTKEVSNRSSEIPDYVSSPGDFFKENLAGFFALAQRLGVLLGANLRNFLHIDETTLSVFFDNLKFSSFDKYVTVNIDHVDESDLYMGTLTAGNLLIKTDFKEYVLFQFANYIELLIKKDIIKIKYRDSVHVISLTESKETIDKQLQELFYTAHKVSVDLDTLKLNSLLVKLEVNSFVLTATQDIEINANKKLSLKGDSEIKEVTANHSITAMANTKIPGTIKRTNSLFKETVNSLGVYEVFTPAAYSVKSGSIIQMTAPVIKLQEGLDHAVYGFKLQSYLSSIFLPIISYLTVVDSILFMGANAAMLSNLSIAATMGSAQMNSFMHPTVLL